MVLSLFKRQEYENKIQALNETLHKEEKESLTVNLELENKLEQTRSEYEKKMSNLKKELNELR